VVTLLLPVVSSWIGSFQGEKGWSLLAYKEALLGGRGLSLLRNTLLLGLCTTAAATAIGVPLALIAGRTDTIRWRTAVPLLLVPLLIPPYLHAVAWLHLLGPGSFLSKTLPGAAPSWLERSVYGLPGTAAALSFGFFPVAALCALASLLGADPRLEEEARLHAGPLRVLLSVTVPAALPGIVSGAVLVFLLAVVDFGVADQLLYRVYPTEIFAQFSAFWDHKAAIALSVAPTLVCLLVVGGWRAWISLWPQPDRGRFDLLPPPVRLRGWRRVVVRSALTLPVVVVALPVVSLLASTSLRAIGEAFRSAGDEIQQSLFISTVSAAACVCAGLLGVGLRPGKLPSWGIAVTGLLFVLPAPVVGVSLVTFWNRPGLLGLLYGTDGMLVLGMVSRFLFVALVVLAVAQRSISRDILDQSLVDGAGWAAALIRVAFPLMLPGVAGALVACLTLTLGELGVSVLIVPPGGTTLAVRIMTLMHFGPEPVLAGTALILMMIVLAPAVVAAGLAQQILGSARS